MFEGDTPKEQEIVTEKSELSIMVGGLLQPHGWLELIQARRTAKRVFDIGLVGIEIVKYIKNNPIPDRPLRVENVVNELGTHLKKKKRMHKKRYSNLAFDPANAFEDELGIFFLAVNETVPIVKRYGTEGNLKRSLKGIEKKYSGLSGMVDPIIKKLGKPTVSDLDSALESIGYTNTTRRRRLINTFQEEMIGVLSRSIWRYRHLREVFKDLPKNEKFEILKSMSKLQTDENKMTFLEDIFQAHESSSLEYLLHKSDKEIKDLPELIGNETLLKLIGVLINKGEKYSFHLAEILAEIPTTELPQKLLNKFRTRLTQIDYDILPSNGSWYLCNMSERRLEQSLNRGAVLLVDNFLFVKFVGKMSALCLETVTDPSGETFVRGVWYSPKDRALRNQIRTAFDRGEARIDSSGGSWVVMRSLNPRDRGMTDQQVQACRQYAENMPDHFPPTIDGYPRSVYRQQIDESM